MRVLHVTPVFYPAHADGGPVTAFLELCRGLAQLGCEVMVLTTDAHGWDKSLDVETDREVEIMENLRVRYCRRVMSRSVSPAILRLLPYYIRWAEVVHLGSVYNFTTIPTLMGCALTGKPIVWSPDGAFHRWSGSRRTVLKTIWEWICRVVAPERLIIHATSEKEARDSQAHFPNAEVMIIPHSVPIPKSVSHVETKGGMRLLYLGRLDPIKGIENLLDACQIVSERKNVSWSLTIAGAGDPRYTATLNAKMSRLSCLPDQVRMIGHVEGALKEQLFQNTDLLVVPSYSENFGVVVAEALVRGIPVVSSTGTPWNRIEELGCGLWVKNDPESLAKAIERMNRMPLHDMGRRGRTWATTTFSSRIVAKSMVKCYKSAALPSAMRSVGHAV